MPKRKSQRFILWLDEMGMEDLELVGGKNASLGEMMRNLGKKGVLIPWGFATTSYAYRYFLIETGIQDRIKEILSDVDPHDMEDLSSKGKMVRDLIIKTDMPKKLEDEIVNAYRRMCEKYGAKDIDVAVRSSATAEDIPEASFAGIQDTYLNIRGEYNVVDACKRCYASLFNNRAISYRIDKGFDHFSVSLSVCVQKMVRSDMACAGVAFSIDTESGFRDVVYITGSYGLGEMVVQGQVNPDEFYVHKPTLKKGFRPIISKKLGDKQFKLVYSDDAEHTTKKVQVFKDEREKFILNDDEILELARWVCIIEDHYKRPMDVEWAKDGDGINVGTGKIFVVQARPETVKVHEVEVETYILDREVEEEDILLRGMPVGTKIGKGRVNVIDSAKRIGEFKLGEVLVTDMTDPDWEPIMKMASAIITNRGGRTCHAAIISRELGIPCIIGTERATEVLKTGMEVTVDCSTGIGRVLKGLLPFHIDRMAVDEIPDPKTDIMMNAGIPEQAFHQARFPNDGVGLARKEFIINSYIGIHPLALLDYEKLKEKVRQYEIQSNEEKDKAELGVEIIDEYVAKREKESEIEEIKKIIELIDERTKGYINKDDFFVDELARGIGCIAAAFYREERGKVKGDVIVRFSDFKTNEYANLIGGKFYEPKESNPMIGWRGASRYYHQLYERAFALECKAIKKVRDEMGLVNVKVMVPFCRTVEEGKKVIETMKKYGLIQGENGLEIYVMAEIPSNVILASEFSKYFDGFSIGTNDLTQLALGLDRDSELVQYLYDERNDAVRILLSELIKKAHAHKPRRKVGICGQAPSDFPSIASFLVEAGIDSMSLNTDTVVNTRILVYFAEIAKKEKKRLVYVEDGGERGPQKVKMGVDASWLREKAGKWVDKNVQKAIYLKNNDKAICATLLNHLSKPTWIDYPGGERVALCWKVEDVDLKALEGPRIKFVDIRTVGSLTVSALLRNSKMWINQQASLGNAVPILSDPAKIDELLSGFDKAHKDYLVEKFINIIFEMVENERRMS